MPVVKNLKKIGSPAEKEVEVVKVAYDFSEDAGAVGVYDLLKSQGDCFVRFVCAITETALTSGGAPTFDIGLEGGAEFAADAALTSFDAIDEVYSPAAIANTRFIKVADAQDITFEIKTATVTAGKVHFYFEVIKGY